MWFCMWKSTISENFQFDFLRYSLIGINSEKFEFWVPFYVKKVPFWSPFCSKLGPLFTIFGSPWDCVSVALSRHFLYLIHIWAFFGTILELSGTLSLFSWKWKCRYFHENGRKTCRTGKKGVALLHNGSPLGSPGPLGDLFGDLGPLLVPFSCFGSPFFYFRLRKAKNSCLYHCRPLNI